jgi:hypothetical protein
MTTLRPARGLAPEDDPRRARFGVGDVVNDVRWLNKDQQFTWMSERNGWRRMYSVSRDGATVKALSADSMDVTHPAFAFGAQAVLGTDATGE